MRFLGIWLATAMTIATPSYGEEKGTLDRAYEGALKAAEKIFGPEERPHVVDKTKNPQIIIKGGEMRYNGQLLKMGDTFSNWVKVLGNPSRFDGIRIYTWDRLGIVAWLQSRGAKPGFNNNISTMEIFLNFKPIDPDLEKGLSFRPKSLFPGYLEIDGAGVDHTSKVWEVNWNKNMFGDPVKHGFQRAHLPTIFRAVSPPPEYELDMSFYTDKKGRDGMIYSLSID